MNKIIFVALITLAAENYIHAEEPQFKSKEDCEKSDVCYCSVKCGFRKKTPKDKPVYVENDPNGIHCYCKKMDFDLYAKLKADGGTSCKDENTAKKQSADQPAAQK